jgi:tRNA threonylcarbamoyladenosine biosynthesis protein TsaB
MSLMLNIDTALEVASLCISQEGKPLGFASNAEQKDHSRWLHPAIRELLRRQKITLQDIRAIAVTAGPGSYTGLRVGLAAAKGLCYALDIPLVTITTLDTMAFAVKGESTDLICPLIDARRMEVFTAVFDQNLNQVIPPHAMIINETSFAQLLSSHELLFCGSGSKKLQAAISHPKARFTAATSNATHLASIAWKNFCEERFSDLAYTEPLYLKEFYSPTRK